MGFSLSVSPSLALADTKRTKYTAASPFHFNWSDAKSELLDPAIKGTTSVLRSIHTFAPGVKRAGVTSSFVAMIPSSGMDDASKVFNKSDWNPITYEEGLKGDKAAAYRAS